MPKNLDPLTAPPMTLSLAVVDGGVVVAFLIVSYVEKMGILLPNDQIFFTSATRGPTLDANLAHAFTAKCNVHDNSSDWYVDFGASTHMTPSATNLTTSTPYNGNKYVAFGNGNILNISQIGKSSLTKDINLANVLLVPKLTKNILSISTITSDSPIDVLFSNHKFAIQKQHTKEVLAKGMVDNGLYVLSMVIKLWLLN